MRHVLPAVPHAAETWVFCIVADVMCAITTAMQAQLQVISPAWKHDQQQQTPVPPDGAREVYRKSVGGHSRGQG